MWQWGLDEWLRALGVLTLGATSQGPGDLANP